MSRTSLSPSPAALSDGEILSGDEEKAISSHAKTSTSNKVNTYTRPFEGSSSRPSHTGGRNTWKHWGDVPTDHRHFRDDDSAPRYKTTGVRERSRSPWRKPRKEPKSKSRSGSESRSRSRSRSRSPWRPGEPKTTGGGEKRRREDDHYNVKNGSDPRRFKVHYEDDTASSSAERKALSRADHNGRHGNAFRRDRSPSPFRRNKAKDRRNMYVTMQIRDRPLSTDATSSASSARETTTGMNYVSKTPDVQSDGEMKVALNQQKTPFSQASQSSSQPQVDELDNEDTSQPKLSEAEIIEQRRKRREAIKNKHRSQPELLVQALVNNVASAPSTPVHDSSAQQSPPSLIDSPKTPKTPALDSPPDSPAAFAVADDEELANRNHADDMFAEEEGPSAADYDPNMDMQEDRPDYIRPPVEESTTQVNDQDSRADKQPAAPAKSKEFDMFADDDDDDDMFAPTDSKVKPTFTAKQAKTLDQSMLDNWDYPDGHYRIIIGELLDNRYAVQQQVGKGTFATVVVAEDTRTGSPVAIKIAANNETMYKAGQKEMDFLKLLNDNDLEDKKHIIRLLRHFDHKGHMCIVFEALSADLRWVLKKFGRNVGLNIKAIRSYAQQMFLALSHMKKCQILHADLKPDNILVSEKRNMLKICDLGTAAFVTDTELTPYLVSRFYRAPEVILGMPFDYAIDMWSIGCTLFELYTGRILFAGADNNQMLRVIQECRGKIPLRMLKLSNPDQRAKYFDDNANFFSSERDKITGKTTMRQMNLRANGEPGKDLRARLQGNAKGLNPQQMKEHLAFVDLLDRCLQLDPGRRITPVEALRHAFVSHGHGGPEVKEKKVVPAMAAPGMSRVR